MRVNSDYAEVILNMTGLLAYWPCDDSSPQARDLKGGGGLGTFAGTVRQGQRSAMAGRDATPGFAFTAVAGSKVTGTGTNFNVNSGDDFSVIGWLFMPTTVTANVSAQIVYGPTSDTGGAKRGLIKNGNVVTGWGFGGGADVATAVDYRAGRPELYAETKASTTVTVSRNGVSLASGTPTLSTASQHWGFGEAQGAFITAQMTGNLSHVAIFNRGLSLNELKHLYTEGSR